jgi:hypothetical protein
MLAFKTTKASKRSSSKTNIYYSKHGWTRTIQDPNLKLRWLRTDFREESAKHNKKFDIEYSADVRKLDFTDASDHMRSGRVSLVRYDQTSVNNSSIQVMGKELVSFTEIALVSTKEVEEKIQWFQDTCAKLCVWSGIKGTCA